MSEPPADSSDPLRARALSRVGQTLRGKWRLVRLLGVGGMAAVYEGTHRNGKRGAVKMLHPELGLSDEARARFLREGYAANRVEHPGAVSVLDDDTAEDGSVFLVMELLEGETADARAERRPGQRIELGEALVIADELLDVLASAHDKGIIHRDLKPENIFITRRGEVKVLDFGIARVREAGSVKATATGIAMGTPAFMPPEQALGDWSSVDARSDLWAIGATLFSLLSGRYVHQADTLQKLMLAAMTALPPSFSWVRPDLPPEVGQVIDRALAFDRAQRWQDARSMQQAVRELRARWGGSLVEGADASPRLRPPDAMLAAAATVASPPAPSTGPEAFAATHASRPAVGDLVGRAGREVTAPAAVTYPLGGAGAPAGRIKTTLGVVGAIAAGGLLGLIVWAPIRGARPAPAVAAPASASAAVTAAAPPIASDAPRPPAGAQEPVASAGSLPSNRLPATSPTALPIAPRTKTPAARDVPAPKASAVPIAGPAPTAPAKPLIGRD